MSRYEHKPLVNCLNRRALIFSQGRDGSCVWAGSSLGAFEFQGGHSFGSDRLFVFAGVAQLVEQLICNQRIRVQVPALAQVSTDQGRSRTRNARSVSKRITA